MLSQPTVMATPVRASRFICAECRAGNARILGPPNKTSKSLGSAYNARNQPRCSNAPSTWSFFRAISSTTPKQKKKLKLHEKEQERFLHPDPGMKKASEEALFDFTPLEDSIAKAHSKLKEGLSKLRPGGAMNPELIENIRFKLNKESKEPVRLADVAQCVPRGRTMMIIAGDKDYVKPITSAIHASDLSLTPEKDQQNPLQINIKLPAPTAESRENTVKEAVRIGETTRTNITQAGRAHHKKLEDMKKRVRADDFFKAREQMNKVVENANTETKRIVDSAKKVLESR